MLEHAPTRSEKKKRKEKQSARLAHSTQDVGAAAASGERPMADGGEMDEEAMRAFFPMSFGKAPTRAGAAASAHASTLRKPPQNPSAKPSTSSAAAAAAAGGDDDDDDDDGPMVGPPRPPPQPAGGGEGEDDEEGGGVMIGPPRPPPRSSSRGEGEDADGGMIGPPRPPPVKDDDEEDEDDDDDDDDDGDDSDDEMEDDGERYNRIPLSNEVVLRGHTKVAHKQLADIICLSLLKFVCSNFWIFIVPFTFVSFCE